MTFPYGHPLFDPEVPDSSAGGGDDPNVVPVTTTGGSTPEGTDPKATGAADPAVAGAEDKTPPYITDIADRLGQIESGIAANSAVNAALTKHGIGDADALDKQLDLLSRINQNPAMKQVMDSLSTVDPAVVPTGGSPQPAPTGDLSKMSLADMQTIISQTVLQGLTQHQETQNKQRFDNDSAIESRFIGGILKDPAYKDLVKEHDFDALIAGKGSAAGNALAILTDQLMFQRGVKDPQTGLMRPVTDATVAAEVGKQLQSMMAELRTSALLAASQDPSGIENPDALALAESHFVDIEATDDDAYDGDPDPKAVQEHFRKIQQQTVAVLEGSPAAAILGVG